MEVIDLTKSNGESKDESCNNVTMNLQANVARSCVMYVFCITYLIDAILVKFCSFVHVLVIRNKDYYKLIGDDEL